MDWLEQLNADPLPWLLESDPENPGVRYFALVELLGTSADAPEVLEARKELMTTGPVPVILDAQNPDGYWEKPGPGYYSKYRGTAWQIIFLAQLGADPDHPSVKAACEYILEHNPAPYGGFSYNGKNSGLIHCLAGNLCAALIDLGWGEDERLQKALDWLARSVTGEGIAPAERRKEPIRYLRSGNSGPRFSCSANAHLPCAWGAIKAMLAFSKVPQEAQTPSIQTAIETGVEFLFLHDPAAADYPMGYSEKPNQSWFKFGYPIGYVTDVLQNLEVLTALGYGNDSRLSSGLELLLNKQDQDGRWPLEYTYNGKTWADIEQKKQPSKWVTLRALRVLKRVAESGEIS
jgi:hypothetical protein